MKLFKKILQSAIVTGSVLIGATSCISDLDTMPLDDNSLVNAQVYSSRDGYLGVLAKCYASLILTGQKGGDGGDRDLQNFDEGYSGYVRILFYLQEQTSDNMLMHSTSRGLRQCLNLTYDASNCEVLTGCYQRLYMAGAYCNEFLRASTESSIKGYGVWEQMSNDYLTMRAEARLIRAYTYLMLCDLYGNVPVIDENVGVKELPVQRTRKEVWQFVEAELKSVIGEGSSDEVLAEPGMNVYARVDKAAAWMILARLYLNAQEWIGENHYQEAYEYSRKVIDCGKYPLASDWRHIFLADNNTCKEIVWPLVQDGAKAQSSAGTNFYVKAFVNGAMESLYKTGVGTKGWGNARCKTTFVDAFDDNDVHFDINDPWGNNKNDKRAQFMDALDGQTKATWTGNDEWSSKFTHGYSCIKWRNVTKDNQDAPSGSVYTSIDFPLLRSAEAYLTAAEAILRGASGSRQEALEYINEVRCRAYMSDNYACPGIKSSVSGKITDSDLTLDFLLDELQREFATECHRRTDLVRFGKYTSGKNWDWKGTACHGQDVSPHLKIFPIPASEMVTNPNLKQNDGYASTTAH